MTGEGPPEGGDIVLAIPIGIGVGGPGSEAIINNPPDELLGKGGMGGLVCMAGAECSTRALNVAGNALGRSKPLSFKLISLQAILNSLIFIFPSASVSDNAQIIPNIAGGNWDWSKSPLAWSPVTIPLTGFNALNCCSNRALSAGVII